MSGTQQAFAEMDERVEALRRELAEVRPGRESMMALTRPGKRFGSVAAMVIDTNKKRRAAYRMLSHARRLAEGRDMTWRGPVTPARGQEGTVSPKRLRKMALYLKYIAFLIEEECRESEQRTQKKPARAKAVPRVRRRAE